MESGEGKEPRDDEVIPPVVFDSSKAVFDSSKRQLYSGDGYPIRKGSRVFVLGAETISRGFVKRVNLAEAQVIVNFGSLFRPKLMTFEVKRYELGDGFSFEACPKLGADEDRLTLLI